jgi:UDP-glucose 4-epimerase
MKILITGGTGRIGANLAKRLLEMGHDVRSFVYPADASRAHKLDEYNRVETVVGDLRNLDDVKRAVDGVDAIYHLAAAFMGPFDNLQYLHINGMGTLNILECIRTDCPNLHRFVYACTEAIYWRLGEKGRFFEEPITEDMVSRYKQMPYFLTKWIGEELSMSYHIQYGVPTTVFRFATVIEPGEFLNEDGLPGLFLFSPAYNRVKDETGDDAEEREIIESIKSLWTGEEKFLLTRNPNGTPYKQEFTDVRDIVQGLVLGIEKDEALGEEFTLGGAALFKWEEAVPYLSERYNLDYVDARVLSSNHFEFDLTKIKTLLGYQPEHELESVLDTAEAIRRGEDVGIIPTGIRWGKA